MGLVYADIRLTNADDLALVRRKLLDPSQVRSMTVKANVDSGAEMLCINEEVNAQIELPTQGTQVVELADGSVREVPIVGPVDVRIRESRNVLSCDGD